MKFGKRLWVVWFGVAACCGLAAGSCQAVPGEALLDRAIARSLRAPKEPRAYAALGAASAPTRPGAHVAAPTSAVPRVRAAHG